VVAAKAARPPVLRQGRAFDGALRREKPTLPANGVGSCGQGSIFWDGKAKRPKRAGNPAPKTGLWLRDVCSGFRQWRMRDSSAEFFAVSAVFSRDCAMWLQRWPFFSGSCGKTRRPGSLLRRERFDFAGNASERTTVHVGSSYDASWRATRFSAGSDVQVGSRDVIYRLDFVFG